MQSFSMVKIYTIANSIMSRCVQLYLIHCLSHKLKNQHPSRMMNIKISYSSQQTKMARPSGGSKNNGLKSPKEEISVKYMHRPPLITPNYGNHRKTLLPKSKVSRVLLYDNATQDHMLDIKLAHINIEKERICRIINLHKKSFSARMQRKQLVMQALAANTSSKHSKASGSVTTHEPVTSTARASDIVCINSGMSPNQGDAEQVVNLPTVEESEAENEANINIDDIKLPSLDSDKRHVIFKVKDKAGKTEVYHTVDEDGVLSDIIPMHSFYTRLVDDPRFKSLQSILVPLERPDTWVTCNNAVKGRTTWCHPANP